MTNDKGQKVEEAGPSCPVEITGLAEVPAAGDIFNAVEDEKLARELEDMGADMICIKDMANLLLPMEAYSLVKALKETETFHFTLVPSLNNEMRSEESPYDAVVSIPRGLLDNKAKVCIYSRKEVPVNLLSYVQTTLDDQVRQQRLKASGIAQLDKIIRK